MALRFAATALLLNLAVTGSSAVEARDTAPGPTGTSAVELVQFRDVGGRGSLFERPTLRQPGSLFPQRTYRSGPHYHAPAIQYLPPAVIYRPPTVAERTVRGRCEPRALACPPNERPCRCP